jgi:DNA/RNA-binding domain of Phe-tRNA-synthetase-like protein
LAWLTIETKGRSSPRAVKERLRSLSDRFHGAKVVAMRTQPVPHAYRAFFHQIGLDPDASRIPSEEAAVARLLQGGFRSRDLLTDALLIALVETGVPVWALDADMVEVGGLGIRTTEVGERFGSVEQPLPAGRLVVADARRVHALLFGPLAPGHAANASTARVALFAVGVDGVPAIHIEEALWTCGDVLTRV